MNMYIICILDEYIKDRDADPGDYVVVDKKSIKVNLYKISIIAVDILNGLDIIIFTNIVYYPTFLANVALAKYF